MPVAESPIRHRGCPPLTQAQVASWLITAGLTEELASKENSSRRLSRGKPASWMRLGGPAAVPVVELGHHQLGEEAEVGQLSAFGGGGDLGEPVVDGGQPQQAGAGVDRRDRHLLGHAPPGGRARVGRGGHELAFPSSSS